MCDATVTAGPGYCPSAGHLSDPRRVGGGIANRISLAHVAELLGVSVQREPNQPYRPVARLREIAVRVAQKAAVSVRSWIYTRPRAA
jgi:hypothetical protein